MVDGFSLEIRHCLQKVYLQILAIYIIPKMSSFSVVDNASCGLARIAMHEIQHQCHGLKHHPCEISTAFKARIFHQFQTLFIDRALFFNIPYEIFRKQLPKTKDIMVRLGKRHNEKKKQLIDGFSSKLWMALSPDEKNQHTYSNCFGCQHDPKFESLHGLFPTKNIGNIEINKTTSEKEICSTSSGNNLETNSLSKHTLQTLMQSTTHKRKLKEITKEIFNQANTKIQETFPGLNIIDAATVAPEFKLEKEENKG